MDTVEIRKNLTIDFEVKVYKVYCNNCSFDFTVETDHDQDLVIWLDELDMFDELKRRYSREELIEKLGLGGN